MLLAKVMYFKRYYTGYSTKPILFFNSRFSCNEKKVPILFNYKSTLSPIGLILHVLCYVMLCTNKELGIYFKLKIE